MIKEPDVITKHTSIEEVIGHSTYINNNDDGLDVEKKNDDGLETGNHQAITISLR